MIILEIFSRDLIIVRAKFNIIYKDQRKTNTLH